MHTITLFIEGDNWMAQHSDPRIKELFGTDTIPTPFTSDSPAAGVLLAITDLNPDRKVGLGDAEIKPTPLTELNQYF